MRWPASAVAVAVVVAAKGDPFETHGNSSKMRKSVDGYNLQLIDGAMLIMSAVVIVAYLVYTTSQEIIEKFQSENLYLTALFVIFGILRYLQLTFVEKNSGSPTEIIFKDTVMQINLVLWISAFVWIIYMTSAFL